MKKALLILCLLALFIPLQAQNKPGTWQDYYSYGNAIRVADAGDRIYCATDGGLFSVDLTDNSVQTISPRDGLSDAGIQTITWNDAYKMLLVIYKNSNIDLVTDERVINLSDISRKLMSGDKSVYNICFYDDAAFLACGFGIVEINLDRREIRGTYIIGDKGASIRVLDVETDGTTIYAATETGILKASLQNTNLLDYRNWTRVENIPHASEKFSHLAMLNNRLVAVFTPDQQDGDQVYLLNNGQWQRVIPEVTYVNDMIVHAGFLTVTSREEIFLCDPSLSLVGRIKEYTIGNQTLLPIQTRSAITSTGGLLWIADYLHGLIRLTGNKFEQIRPQGPLNNDVYSITAFQNDLWVAIGGRTDNWNNQYKQPAFERFREGEWNYFTQKELPELTGFWDVVEIEVDPRDPNHVFVASWGGGVIELKNDKVVKRYNNQNSPLQTALPEAPAEPYTRIGGIAFDDDGNLWVSNSQSSRGLHRLSPTGEWTSIELPEASGTNHRIGQLIVTRDGDKWVVLPSGHDLYVVNEEGTQKRKLPVTSYFNNGVQEILNRMNDVYSIVEDLGGEIWIGTSKGVAVFSNPGRVWEEQSYYAWQPSLELNDGNYHPLLETEMITSIVVDGANRKWIGTSSSGIYLISERGDHEILHFTNSNSPLPSNTITSLALNPVSGELFIGTDKGLISYMGDAPQGSDTYAGVYVYPNPVRETYHGDVTVAGLMKDTDVRITDVSGNLVHKGKSLGSKLIWDGKNLNGKRVSSGVYLVFCTDATGDQTKIAKLLFIH